MYKTQVKRFLVVGFTTIIIDYIVYVALVNILGYSYMYKGISFIAGAVYSFVLNSLYTFNQERLKISQLIKFAIVYIISLSINVSVNAFLVERIPLTAHVSIFISFSVATLASCAVNFSSMKFFVFK